MSAPADKETGRKTDEKDDKPVVKGRSSSSPPLLVSTEEHMIQADGQAACKGKEKAVACVSATQ